jgi:hypothetical protein
MAVLVTAIHVAPLDDAREFSNAGLVLHNPMI